MTARDQANELKNQAIDLLLREREAIEEELKALGYGEIKAALPLKKRGRPPKQQTSLDPLCTTQSILTSPNSEDASRNQLPTP